MIQDTSTGFWKLTIKTLDTVKNIHYVFHDHSLDSTLQTYFTWDNNSNQNWNIYLSPVTGIKNILTDKPTTWNLFQNYPNPFNPTTINYSVPKTSFVIIKVYDVLEKIVATLINEEKMPGNYNVEFDGSDLPSGVYFYQLDAGDFVATKKLLLLK